MSFARTGALVFAGVSLLALPAASNRVTRAQVPTGEVRGIVRDTQKAALPGVSVVLSRADVADRRTASDARGEFSFPAVEPGRYVMTARLSGFTDLTKLIDVTSGKTTQLSLGIKSLQDCSSSTQNQPR